MEFKPQLAAKEYVMTKRMVTSKMKYRKKPVIVEAEVYSPGMEDGFECFAIFCPWGDCKNQCGKGKPFIRTLEGNHLISPGDYIITGIKGERYPCKPDIFHATYEIIKETEI